MTEPSHAGADAPATRPDDVATIDGIVRAFYEVVSGPAGQSADAERDRSLHHPEARVTIADRDRAGRPTVRTTSLADYHADAPPRAEPFWEWETARVVQQAGTVAHLWSSYASAREPGGAPFARGVNSIALFHDGTRWWIMGWMFDRSAATQDSPS
jgi:hypothetical protein